MYVKHSFSLNCYLDVFVRRSLRKRYKQTRTHEGEGRGPVQVRLDFAGCEALTSGAVRGANDSGQLWRSGSTGSIHPFETQSAEKYSFSEPSENVSAFSALSAAGESSNAYRQRAGFQGSRSSRIAARPSTRRRSASAAQR